MTMKTMKYLGWKNNIRGRKGKINQKEIKTKTRIIDLVTFRVVMYFL